MVAVVGIECNGAATEVVLSRIFQNSVSKMTNLIIVDIVRYLKVITDTLLATNFKFLFPLTKIWA